MLSIGAAMLGAQHVVGVDVDEDALRTAQQNVDEYEDYLPVSKRATAGPISSCLWGVWRRLDRECLLGQYYRPWGSEGRLPARCVLAAPLRRCACGAAAAE